MTVSTEMPIAAERAFAEAHKIGTMEYVMRPLLGIRIDATTIDRVLETHQGNGLPLGVELGGRLVLLGVIPLWKHQMTIIRDDSLELYTNEVSGPAKIWNHRLTFEPLGPGRCRYTDEIEIESGPSGFMTGIFIKFFFAHRHRRWKKLARSLATD